MRYVSLYLAAALVYAQPANVGGDVCGYRWYTHLAGVPDSTPTYDWVEISELTNPQYLTGLGDDNFAGPIILPFSFVYYWNSYNKIYVGSNGYIVFERGANVSSGAPPYFPTFPNPAAPNEWIGAYVSDLTFTDDAGAPIPRAKLVYGVDGNGRFVITWDSVPYWNGNTPGHWSGRNSFQIILDPNDSSITLQYKEITTGYHSSYSNGNFNVVGMENITGQSGLNIAAAWPVPFSEYVIKIWHPRTFACSVTDVQADWSLTPRGEGIFVIKNGVSPSLQAGVLNTGNQVVSNQVRSVLRVLGPGSGTTVIYADTIFIQPPFNPSASFVSTYTKPFNSNRSTPTSLATGSYRAIHMVTIMGGGDGFAGNNQYLSELVISDSLTTGPNRGAYILRYDDGIWDPANEEIGGVSFANGMVFVAPQDIEVEALSVDMLSEDAGTSNYPLALWVYNYDLASGAVGTQIDSVGIDVLDFGNGEVLANFTGQNNQTFTLRRYTVPLSSPLSLAGGQAIAVGFKVLSPSNAGTIGNFVVADESVPISRRGLEGIAGIWAPDRNLEGVDYAVGLVCRLSQSMSIRTASNGGSWNFTVFPNPSTEAPFIRFDLPHSGKVHVRIVDIAGQLVWQGDCQVPAGRYKFRIPVSLPAGTYFVGATYQGYTQGVRFVIAE
ncbi:MAG: T9SS type A sorting domain-containing protein [Bacteroidia bacterium]|nr:T9SS type A sorting domain-containing protein [Bacteroidia bacterium]MDW8134958.1 T9SS type A sorting domain-containing protein [Bacteroidia bacterium]